MRCLSSATLWVRVEIGLVLCWLTREWVLGRVTLSVADGGVFVAMKRSTICVVVLAVGLALVALLLVRPAPADDLIALRELPGVTQQVLEAQGSLFRIGEPFLYNRQTKMAAFVVEILSGKNFGDETHLTFGGDAKSLESFSSEIRMVNSGPSRVGGAGDGMADGVKSLVSGVWQLFSHPIDTITGLGGAAASLAVYVKDTPLAKVQTDVSNLVSAFYVNRACEVAEGHLVDYFELKTDAGRVAVHTETNYRLGGQAFVEVATILVPFSKLKYGEEAEKAAEAARAADVVVEAAKCGPEAAKFAKAGRLFPRMSQKMGDSLLRLKYTGKPSRFTPPVARLGQTASMDYRATFLAKYPQLDGKVVVHHAVEQQALRLYPGVFTEGEIHSLENLRGIPKGLDSTMHKSEIAREWRKFYSENPAGPGIRQKLLDKATDIDRRFGHQFQPNLL